MPGRLYRWARRVYVTAEGRRRPGRVIYRQRMGRLSGAGFHMDKGKRKKTTHSKGESPEGKTARRTGRIDEQKQSSGTRNRAQEGPRGNSGSAQSHAREKARHSRSRCLSRLAESSLAPAQSSNANTYDSVFFCSVRRRVISIFLFAATLDFAVLVMLPHILSIARCRRKL